MRTSRFSALIALLGSFLGPMLWQSSALAYYSVIDTGEVIAPGSYKATFEPQFIFNRYEGMNAVARFDTGVSESTSVRGILGVGSVSFELGAMVKWIPIPDTAGQPAIGGEFGVTIARVEKGTEYNFRAHPLVSKKFESEVGDFTPYGSLPLGIAARPDKTVIPIQLVAGCEFQPLNLKKFSFFGEIGAQINESFSYLSAAVVYRFDDSSLRSSGE